MTALSNTRLHTSKGGNRFSNTAEIGASVYIYQGAMVGINAAGYCVPVTAATGLKSVGVAQYAFDNSSGANGAADMVIEYGQFVCVNDDTNVLDRTHRGTLAYGEDDQTVGDDATGKSPVGVLVGFDADGAPIVEFTPSTNLLA